MFKRYKVEMNLVKRGAEQEGTTAVDDGFDKTYAAVKELLWISFQGAALLVVIAGATKIAVNKFS